MAAQFGSRSRIVAKGKPNVEATEAPQATPQATPQAAPQAAASTDTGGIESMLRSLLSEFLGDRGQPTLPAAPSVTTTQLSPAMGALAVQDAQEQAAIRSASGITESLGRPSPTAMTEVSGFTTNPQGASGAGVTVGGVDAAIDRGPEQGLVTPLVEATVPEVGTYSIKSGDTLSEIAANSPFTLKQLLEVNQGVDPNRLSIGQEIKLPTVTAEEAVTEEVAAVTTVDTAPVFSYQSKEGSSKGTAERAVYQYAFEQGIKGDELRAFMAQVAHESSEFGRIKEGGLSSKNIQSILDRTKDGKRLDPSGKVRLRFIEDGITSSSGAAAAQNSQYRDGIAPGNGDYASGDGSTFKGRGYIQLTGRSNYKAMGEAIGEDLVNNPDLMLDTDIAKKASVQWWKDNVQTKKPDYTDTTAITKIVNGGTNGLTDRKRLHTKYGVKPKGN